MIVGIKELGNPDARDAPIFLVLGGKIFKTLVVELTKMI